MILNALLFGSDCSRRHNETITTAPFRSMTGRAMPRGGGVLSSVVGEATEYDTAPRVGEATSNSNGR